MWGPEALAWRAGAVEDGAAVAALMARAFDPRFGEAWSEAQLVGGLATAGSWLDIAEAGGALAGFALCRLLVDEVELLLCATDPAWRGRGVGWRLLLRAEEAGRARAARRLFLEVREDNRPARGLYDRAGLIIVGRRRNYYRGGDGRLRDAVTMAKAL